MNSIEAAYNTFVETRFPLPSEKQLADLEVRWRIELPPDYRQFLLEFNGGFFTEPQIIPPDANCPIDRLNTMAGIGATHRSGELGGNTFNPDLFENNDPPKLLPIGYTLMGNLIYLVTQPADRGVIGLKKAYASEYFDLADGIEAFFGLLREPDSK